MYMNPEGIPIKDMLKQMTTLSDQLQLKQVALTCIPNASDRETAAAFSINPDSRVRNTILVFKKRRVIDKVINLNAADLDAFVASCTKTFGSSS